MHAGLAEVGQLLLAVAILTSLVCYVVGYLEAWRFSGPRLRSVADEHSPGPLPPITLLKPLKGADDELHDNLASFCAQTYPTFQIVFGVAEAGDPAVPVVRRLQSEFPSVDLDLVIDGRTVGTNLKVSNLHNMYKRAKHEIILVADSDIRVPPRYLERVVAAFADPGVALTTCLYRGVAAGGLPAAVEALCVNTDFVPLVLLARVAERLSYAFGSTIAVRRAVLDANGGFLPLANYLADDYHLGNRIVASGHRVELSTLVVDTVTSTQTWREVWARQLRWARTQRVCRPGGYFGSVLTHGTLWASVNLLFNQCSAPAVALLMLVCGVRVLTARAVCRHGLDVDLGGILAVLLPIKDLFMSAVWALAFLGNTVHWGGRRLRVMSDGQMVELPPLGQVEAPIRPQP